MSNDIVSGLFAVVLLAAGPAAAEPAPVTVPAAFQHDLAGPGGATWRLFVGLPPDYDPQGEQRYPVIYVLDGNVTFPFVVNAERMFVLFGEAPELIVVGIGYPAEFFTDTFAPRWHDLTPWRNAAIDAAESEKRGLELHSGGAPEFLRFLRERAIPFVDTNYRTTQDRALWGHSFGGLFALYTLFEAPDLFQRYAITSPSVNFSEGSVFAHEAAYAEAHEALQARVFLAHGSEEQALGNPVARLVAVLRTREYEGLELQTEVFPGETHVSVFPGAFSRGLRFMYGDTDDW